MNIVMLFWIWFFVCIGCTVMACVKSINRKRNLISIVPLTVSTVSTTVSTWDAELLGNHNHSFRKCRCVQGTNINRIEFNHDKLYRIGRRVGMDPRYKLIDRSACTRIRKLCLNRRGKKRRKEAQKSYT